MYECKSIHWQSQMCAGPKKPRREDDTTGLHSPAIYFWGGEVRIFHQQKYLIPAVQVCVGKWARKCTHTEPAVHSQEKWGFSSCPLFLQLYNSSNQQKCSHSFNMNKCFKGCTNVKWECKKSCKPYCIYHLYYENIHQKKASAC